MNMIVCRLQGKDSVWWGTLAVAWWVSQVLLPVAVWAQSPGAMDSGANRTRQAEQAVAPEPEKYSERVRVKPTEGYIAGFGGYTFGGKFDTEGIGNLSGVSFGNRSLADSGVYGAKAGGFFSDELSWFGVELEAFNTTPNIQQQGAAPGSYMRVTTNGNSAACSRTPASGLASTGPISPTAILPLTTTLCPASTFWVGCATM
jgi:hypothetical protein